MIQLLMMEEKITWITQWRSGSSW